MDQNRAVFLDLEPVTAAAINMDRDGTCFFLNHAEQQHLLAGVKEGAAIIIAQDRDFCSVEFLDPSLARNHEFPDDGIKVPARARSRWWLVFAPCFEGALPAPAPALSSSGPAWYLCFLLPHPPDALFFA